MTQSTEKYLQASSWGINNRMSLNTMYLARIPIYIIENVQHNDTNLRSGLIQSSNLYIANDKEALEQFKNSIKDHFEIYNFKNYFLIKKIS